MKPQRTKQVIGIVSGSLLIVLSPIFGLLGTTAGMNRAFETLGAEGPSNPNRLASNIHSVLIVTTTASAGVLVGLLVLIASIVLFIRAGNQAAKTPDAGL